MPFQTALNYQPGNAVAGDFASNNPRSIVLAGPGGLVAGTGGIVVGTFAWVQTDGVTALNSGTVAPSGFVSRQDMQAVISTYLAETGETIPAGFGVTVYNGGDFFATTTTAAVPGDVVYASTTTPATIQCAASGTAITGFVATSFLAASTAAANSLVKISSKAV